MEKSNDTASAFDLPGGFLFFLFGLGYILTLYWFTCTLIFVVRDPVTIGVQWASFVIHGNPFRGFGTQVIYVKNSVQIGVEWTASLFKVCIKGSGDITGAVGANAKCENRGRINVYNFTAILELSFEAFLWRHLSNDGNWPTNRECKRQ